MWRERWGQRLVALGVLAVVLSLLTIGITRQLVDTGSFQKASADLLAVSTWNDAVGGELRDAFDATYPTLPLSDDQRAFAVERMLANGDLIDEVQRAIGPAHQAWLDGAALELDLDPVVTTRVAIAGVRDANPDVVDSLPSDRLVEVPPVTIPTTITTATVDRYQTWSIVSLVVGLVALVLGAVVSTNRAPTLKWVARGFFGFGALAAAAVLLLPWAGVNQIDHRVEVVGALLVPVRTSTLAVAVVAVLAAWWLHGSADRMARQIHQSLNVDRRRRREATPARSGGAPPVATRKAGRHRTEAIDAFFEPTEAEPSDRITVIDLGELEDDDGAPPADDGVEEAPVGEVDDDSSPPAEPTPEDERAAALAAERREALERIDGTRSGYRTHLPR